MNNRKLAFVFCALLMLCSCMHNEVEPSGVNLTVGDVMPNFKVQIFIPDALDWRVAQSGQEGTEHTQEEEAATEQDCKDESSVAASSSDICLTVHTDDLRGKQVYLLFFNTTCKDCQRELPRIQKLYEQKRGDSGTVFMAIAREQGRDDIVTYWQKEGLTLPYSPQTDKTLYNLFATQTIPQLFVIDEHGIIIEHKKE